MAARAHAHLFSPAAGRASASLFFCSFLFACTLPLAGRAGFGAACLELQLELAGSWRTMPDSQKAADDGWSSKVIYAQSGKNKIYLKEKPVHACQDAELKAIICCFQMLKGIRGP